MLLTKSNFFYNETNSRSITVYYLVRKVCTSNEAFIENYLENLSHHIWLQYPIENKSNEKQSNREHIACFRVHLLKI